MNRRIFPFLNKTGATWRNYSNYLNWINTSINSLKDYLHYFNPNFTLVNASIYAIESNTKKQYTIKELQSEALYELETKLKKQVKLSDDTTITLYFPQILLNRQGYINLDYNAYVCYDYGLLEEFDNTENYDERKEIFDDAISNQTLFLIPPSTAIFSKKWTHKGSQSEYNMELHSQSAFTLLSQAAASLYLPTSTKDKLIFSVVENGQRVLGTNLLFSLELFPTRYYLTKESNLKWHSNATSWNEEGAYWSSLNGDIQKHIQNKGGQVWNNSYPLMHELVCTSKDSHEQLWQEEFICDNEFNIEQVNIANHATMLYNINTTNIDAKETTYWNEFVSVMIL